MPCALVTPLAGSVLVYAASASARTCAVTVQVPPPAATVPPTYSSLCGETPVLAVAVPLTPPSHSGAPTLNSSRFAEGKLSLNAVLVRSTAPLLVMVMVIVAAAPTGTVVGLNVLVMDTGADTVSERLKAALVKPRVLPMAPAGNVLL